jgi:hypothetical protein
VQAGDHDPQQAQQPEDQERVVDPQPAARIARHANIRSHERLFERNNFPRHSRITMVVIGLTLVLVGCLPDPRLAEARELLDQLASARGMLAEQPPRVQEGCGLIGTTATRLYGEPGLADVMQAWPELRDATNALGAVCGQDMLLAEPSTGSPYAVAGRERWQQGIQREMAVACDHLRGAAAALGRGAPC